MQIAPKVMPPHFFSIETTTDIKSIISQLDRAHSQL